jgi:hypothetical protein
MHFPLHTHIVLQSICCLVFCQNAVLSYFWITWPCVLQMLSYGCTRLEIGLQSIFEDVARDTNRGHTVAAVGECFHLAKNAGFKVIAHMMPDLPNMGWERDMESFREFFENPDFRTDGLKVSFCVPYCHMVTLYSYTLNTILLDMVMCLLQDQTLLCIVVRLAGICICCRTCCCRCLFQYGNPCLLQPQLIAAR